MTSSEPKDPLRTIAETARVSPEDVFGVYRLLEAENIFTRDTLIAELRWFYSELGLGAHYFATTPLSLIASHIESLYAAKILARASGERINLHHESEGDDIAIYACREEHRVAIEIERRIEKRYPNHRLQSYHSASATTPGDPDSQLRLYFVMPAEYQEGEVSPLQSDLEHIASKTLLARASAEMKRRYQAAIMKAVQRLGLVIDTYERPDLDTTQLILAFRKGTTHHYFSAVSDLLNSYGVHSRHKYIEPFKNGVVIYSIHIERDVPKQLLEQIHEALSLIYVLPNSELTPLFQRGELNAQQLVYVCAAWRFAHQFLTRYSREYELLAPAFAADPLRLGILAQFKQRLSKDTFTELRIRETIERQIDLVRNLYADFARTHFRSVAADTPIGSSVAERAELEREIRRRASSKIEEQILNAMLTFNRHVLKTNFYRDSKTAVSFRLDPAFLPDIEFPEKPFGIFFLLGSEFMGFHVRFRDIARGGIRIVHSADAQAYARNNDSLFDEAYQLARTQQAKNKDIPEGGSKGALLLALEHQHAAVGAFKKYIDSLLDLMLPNEEIADYYGREELLFLGPDEGTAELMDWAALHAQERSYPFWRAFTTGKSLHQGGIPHDRYGMTTRSVHRFVLGALNRLGLVEEQVTKIQTGGPDGDLGSNEIKIAHDRTIAVIDGSGVLYDPQGIDRNELIRLASARLPVSSVDRSQLSRTGFLVTVDQRDITLPDGRFIESGLALRNEFHFDPLAQADLFVPCGGRPNAVNITNVAQLLDERGNPRFRLIVEGANLFFSQPARRELERAGVVLFKDASANKGGVTSSSLEVLAALCLTDVQYREHMEVHQEEPSDFYRRYVREVLERIEANAELEFECLWREHERTGRNRSDLTDELSTRINLLNDEIQAGVLVQDSAVRHRVLVEVCPRVLLELIGIEAIAQRLPETYIRALVGSHLASRYVYRRGLDASEVRFHEFIQGYLRPFE